MPAKNQPAYKEYPEPVFPSKKARAAYRKAQLFVVDLEKGAVHF